MNKDNGKMFRSRLFGFCKKDVAQYLESYVKQCDKKYSGLEEHDKYLAEQLEDRDRTIAEIRQKYEQKVSECELANKKICEIEQQNAELLKKTKEYERKLAEYDQVKLKLADIEVDAHRRAAQIEQRANNSAKELFEKSVKSIKEMSESVAPIFSSTKEQVRVAEQSLSELKYRLNKINPDSFNIPENLLESAADEAEDNGKTAEQMCSGVDEFVKRLRQKQQGAIGGKYDNF